MWAYTDEEIDYLSTARRPPSGGTLTDLAGKPSPGYAAALLPRFRAGQVRTRLAPLLPQWLRAWWQRQADMLELRRLDERSLTDLAINRGDFPAIIAGTYVRGGEPARTTTATGTPRGDLASRTLAMPADANPSGAIFGGWVMALMDSAGAMTATRIADGRVVTVSVSNITFLQPLRVGNSVCCYADPVRSGNTSLTLNVEVWVLREGRGERLRVTHAEFTFVAVDDAGKPRKLPRGRNQDALPAPA